MPIKTMPETKWFPIFKAGTHKSAEGITKTYTEQDIDAIVAVNSARMAEVPAVKGHPDLDAPAYGWGSGIRKVINDGVAYAYAKLKDVVEPFAEQVQAGQFKNVSIKILPDRTLQHIGFLGAVPPAVTGMPAVSFAAAPGDAIDLTFSSEEMVYMEKSILRRMAGFFGRIRDYIIQQSDVKAADEIISSNEIQWIGSDIDGLDREVGIAVPPVSYSAPVQLPKQTTQEVVMPTEVELLKQKNEELEGKVQQYSAENDSLKKDVQTLTTNYAGLQGQIAQMQKNTQRKEFESFCDSLCAQGKLLPANKEATILTMESLVSAQPLQFSTGATKSALDNFKETLLALPQVVHFSKDAAAGGQAITGSAGEKLDTIAKNKMAADKTLSYAKALDQAQAENRSLAQEYLMEVRGE
jgi:hypothetical protein